MKASVTEKELADIGYTVYDKAYQIYCACDAEEDFCFTIMGYTVLFGEKYRVAWNPFSGFGVIPFYSDTKFRGNFKRFMEYQHKMGMGRPEER